MSKNKNEVTVGSPKLKPNSNKTFPKVLIGVLIGAILGAGNIYCYYKYFQKNSSEIEETKKDTKEEKKENNTTKELKIDDYLVKRLISGIHYQDGSIIEKTLYIEDKTLASNLDNNYLDNLLIKEAYRNKSNFYNEVTIDELEQARINLFGKNYEVVIPTDKDIGTCPIFNYEASKRIYKKSEEKCNITSDINIIYNTVKASILDKKYIYIYETVAFIKENEVYKRIDGSNNLSEKLEGINSNNFDITKSTNFLNQYKYNFKYDKDTNNYIFESIEEVKQ